jgi:hypothetical protein
MMAQLLIVPLWCCSYSNMSDVTTIGNGSDATLRFRMRVGASKVNAAKLHFAWTVRTITSHCPCVSVVS